MKSTVKALNPQSWTLNFDLPESVGNCGQDLQFILIIYLCRYICILHVHYPIYILYNITCMYVICILYWCICIIYDSIVQHIIYIHTYMYIYVEREREREGERERERAKDKWICIYMRIYTYMYIYICLYSIIMYASIPGCFECATPFKTSRGTVPKSTIWFLCRKHAKSLQLLNVPPLISVGEAWRVVFWAVWCEGHTVCLVRLHRLWASSEKDSPVR